MKVVDRCIEILHHHTDCTICLLLGKLDVFKIVKLLKIAKIDCSCIFSENSPVVVRLGLGCMGYCQLSVAVALSHFCDYPQSFMG